MKRLIWTITSIFVVVTGLAGSPRVRAEEPFADAAREMIDLSNVYVRFKVRVLGLVSIVGALIDCSGRSQTIRKAIRQPYACR